MNLTTSEINELFRTIEEQNLSISQTISRIKCSSSFKELNPGGYNCLNKTDNSQIVARNNFTLILDYSKSLKELIDYGKYDWVNKGITEKLFRLPPDFSRKRTVVAKLFHFNYSITLGEVILEILKDNCRPAVLPELLSFGERYPELQKENPPIAALYEFRHFSGRGPVPILSFACNERKLDLCFQESNSQDNFRFLGIKLNF